MGFMFTFFRAGAYAVLPLLLAGACVAAQQTTAVTARVERVDDGDTLRVVMNGQQVRVRIFGIDAPELNQPYGREALEEARRLLANRTVTLVQEDVDPYGRVVASLAVDGHDVGTDLVNNGAAWHFTQFSKSSTLAAAERNARAAGRGLWALPHPVAPWQFRGDERADGRGRGRASATSPAAAGTFHGNVASKVFHAAGCEQFNCPNCRTGFNSSAEAVAAGYRPHATCVR